MNQHKEVQVREFKSPNIRFVDFDHQRFMAGERAAYFVITENGSKNETPIWMSWKEIIDNIRKIGEMHDLVIASHIYGLYRHSSLMNIH